MRLRQRPRRPGMTSLQAVILLGAGFLVAWGLMDLFQDNSGTADRNVALTLRGEFKRPQAGAGNDIRILPVDRQLPVADPEVDPHLPNQDTLPQPPTGATWTEADRVGNTQAWKDANLANLMAGNFGAYVTIAERRDFYKWFYEYTASRGYETRWALAASIVADGARQIADLDASILNKTANDVLGLANVQLQGTMRQGNQVIFDNVFPKLKKLLEDGPLTGKDALAWDMLILSQEQALIQPLYEGMSKATVEQLDYIARKKRFAGLGAALHLPWNDRADYVPEQTTSTGQKIANAGIVPGFNEPDIRSVDDRWTYGMKLGDTFTPGGTGFDPATDTRPRAGAGYEDGTELAEVNTRANLHQLDAFLNLNRLARAGSDPAAIIGRLSEFEKRLVLADRSPDGGTYAAGFAQFGGIDAALVRQALPSDPALAPDVEAFMARYREERKRSQLRNPVPFPFGPMR